VVDDDDIKKNLVAVGDENLVVHVDDLRLIFEILFRKLADSFKSAIKVIGICYI